MDVCGRHVLVEQRYLAAGDIEALLLRLGKERPLVLRELRVVNEGIRSVVVLGRMVSLLLRGQCLSTVVLMRHR